MMNTSATSHSFQALEYCNLAFYMLKAVPYMVYVDKIAKKDDTRPAPQDHGKRKEESTKKTRTLCLRHKMSKHQNIKIHVQTFLFGVVGKINVKMYHHLCLLVPNNLSQLDPFSHQSVSSQQSLSSTQHLFITLWVPIATDQINRH